MDIGKLFSHKSLSPKNQTDLVPDENKSKIKFGNLFKHSPNKKDGNKHNITVKKTFPPELATEYGNKTANLMVLSEKLKSENFSKCGCKIAVPRFIGVKNSKVADFLENNLDNKPAKKGFLNSLRASSQPAQTKELTELWGDFIAAYEKDPNLAEGSDTTNLLLEVQSKIHDAIAHSSDAEIEKLLGGEWKEIKKLGRVMVRSSSEEDGKNKTNAGGNESVPCELTSISDLKVSLADVISSYFSPKSIRQRVSIAQGDIDAIRAVPNCAVLIQKLVGETKESIEPPIGGVIYSQHLIGNTPSPIPLVRVTAARGHCSYVVESLGPVSEFIIDEKGNVNKFQRAQVKRIVPEIDTKLKKVTLSDKQEIKPTPADLPMNVFSAINSMTRQLEKDYGYAVDIEFVYDPTTKELNIVQIRDPGTEETGEINEVPTKEQTPKRIDFSKIEKLKSSESSLEYYKSTPIVTPSEKLFQVIISTGKEETYLFKSDQDAADYFTTNPQIKPAIVIVQRGSLESHGSNMLKGLDIPTVRVNKNDWENLNSALQANPTLNVAVDSLSGLIATSTSLSDLNQITVDGYGGYPLPTAQSIAPLSPDAKKYLMEQIPNEQNEMKPRSINILNNLQKIRPKELGNLSTSLLLQKMKDSDPKTDPGMAKACLAEMTHRIWSSNKMIKYTQTDLDQMALYSICQLDEALNDPDQDRLVFLYHISSLERLWKQDESAEVVGGTSLRDTVVLRNVLTKHQKAETSPSSWSRNELAELGEIFDELADRIQNPTISKEFSLKINAKLSVAKRTWNNPQISKEEKQKILQDLLSPLQSMCETMQQLQGNPKMFNLWINFFAIDQLNGKVSAVEEDKKLELIQITENANAFCSKWESQLGQWENFENIDSLSADFLSEFETAGIAKLVEEVKKCQDPLEKIALVGTLQKSLTLYDQILKRVSGQARKDEETHAMQFQILLKPFVNWSLDSIEAMGVNNFFAPDSLKPGAPNTKWANYKNLIIAKLSPEQFTKSLLQSSGFSLVSCVIGTDANMERSAPKTFEDLFTLAHQNLETINSRLLTDLIPKERLPASALVKKCLEMQIIDGRGATKNSISSVSCNGDSTSIVINLPCNSHAAKITIICDGKTGKTSAKILLFGFSTSHRGYRWNFIRDVSELSPLLDGSKIQQSKYNERKISDSEVREMEFELDNFNENSITTLESLIADATTGYSAITEQWLKNNELAKLTPRLLSILNWDEETIKTIKKNFLEGNEPLNSYGKISIIYFLLIQNAPPEEKKKLSDLLFQRSIDYFTAPNRSEYMENFSSNQSFITLFSETFYQKIKLNDPSDQDQSETYIKKILHSPTTPLSIKIMTVFLALKKNSDFIDFDFSDQPDLLNQIDQLRLSKNLKSAYGTLSPEQKTRFVKKLLGENQQAAFEEWLKTIDELF